MNATWPGSQANMSFSTRCYESCNKEAWNSQAAQEVLVFDNNFYTLKQSPKKCTESASFRVTQRPIAWNFQEINLPEGLPVTTKRFVKLSRACNFGNASN